MVDQGGERVLKLVQPRRLVRRFGLRIAMGAASDHRDHRTAELLLDDRRDLPRDGLALLGRAAQKVDLVDEQDQALRVDAAQDAKQSEIGIGNTLGGIDDDNAGIAGIKAAQGHFFAHQEGIVGAWRINQGQRIGERRQFEKQIGGARNVGVVWQQGIGQGCVGEAIRDVLGDHVRLQRRKRMGRAEQIAECRAQSSFRAMPHGLHLLLQLLRIEARQKSFSEFAQLATMLGQALPFGVIEEPEMGAVFGKTMEPEMQPRDHGRPGCLGDG